MRKSRLSPVCNKEALSILEVQKCPDEKSFGKINWLAMKKIKLVSGLLLYLGRMRSDALKKCF